MTNRAEFGRLNFRVIVEDFAPTQPWAHSQLRLKFVGDNWELGGEREESVGVVVPRVIEFGRSGAVRHWAPFADVVTPEEVVDRVDSYAFGPSPPLEGLRRWDVSSAFARYSLSALFDFNLGVESAVCVRGVKSETFIVRRGNMGVSSYDVSIKAFESAVEGLAGWYDSASAQGVPNEH